MSKPMTRTPKSDKKEMSPYSNQHTTIHETNTMFMIGMKMES
jgi:hypothetical protein